MRIPNLCELRKFKQSSKNISNVGTRKFMKLKESLHSKSFIRIKVVQTIGKDIWFS